jgi:prevent-host-death family protein
MGKLTATEVARNFSEVLNRVVGGERIEITRNGSTLAVLTPSRREFLSAEEFQELMDSAPPVDDEFAEAVLAARAEIGPPEDPWQS